MKLEPGQMEALSALSGILSARGSCFVVIGALVPVLLIDSRSPKPDFYGSRITRDVDVSIRLDGWDAFRLLKSDLCRAGFSVSRGDPEHRLTFGNVDVDIIPFGPEFLKDGCLTWPESGRTMNLWIMGSVFDHSEEVRLENGTLLSVAGIPAAILLKMQVWMDRREMRDLEDILYMLDRYEDLDAGERRFTVLGRSGITFENAGAFLAGRDLSGFRIPNIHAAIRPFWEICGDPASAVIHSLSARTSRKPGHVTDLLNALKKGLESV